MKNNKKNKEQEELLDKQEGEVTQEQGTEIGDLEQIKDMFNVISSAVKEQNRIIIEQQKKIEEQERKINDIISVMTAFLQNDMGMAVSQQNVGEFQEQTGNGQERQIQPSIQSTPTQAPTQPQKQSPFTLDRITEFLKALGIVVSNVGSPRNQEGTNIIGSIQEAISIASGIAGTFGEGLARIFEAFNQMEERAFKSYAARFKSLKIDESDIERAVEKALEKTLAKKLKKAENNNEGG